MKTRLMAGAALAAVFAVATGAQAQTAPINGWYGAIDGGWHDLDSHGGI